MTGEKIIQTIAAFIHQILGAAGLSGIIFIIDPVLCAVAMFGFISLFVMFLVWMERKVSAHMQSRIGPNRVGIFGLLQTVADAVKLTIKEDVKPIHRDVIPYTIAPILAFVATFAGMVVIPFDKGIVVQDLNIGLLYIIAITSFTVIAILSAGWSSNNKFALLGGFRSAAQIVSYEVPLVLSLVPIIMTTGTLRLGGIVDYQAGHRWFIFSQQAIAFFIFITAATAEANRAPFDIPEAESELIGGFHTEYSGVKFAMFFLGEYIAVIVSSAVAVTVFLGGWLPLPFLGFLHLPGFVWFMAKLVFVIYLIMAFRWTFPRLRVDQLMDFGWKVLIPIAILNVLATGFVILLLEGGV
ncbi:MAG TPA: NADH-quinone oxidoreductase subunit NuoH [bacterium]|nr:NADH-quinone oxidoreductase subunit NuoH [bacterium]